MDILQPTPVVEKRAPWRTILSIVGLIVITLFLVMRFSAPGQVTLIASPGTDGKITVFGSLKSIPGMATNYVDLPSGIVCQRIDNRRYGEAGRYFYWVNCDGVTGYVVADQAH